MSTSLGDSVNVNPPLLNLGSDADIIPYDSSSSLSHRHCRYAPFPNTAFISVLFVIRCDPLYMTTDNTVEIWSFLNTVPLDDSILSSTASSPSTPGLPCSPCSPFCPLIKAQS